MAYIFRDSKGRFSKPGEKASAYTQSGKKIYGKRKAEIVKKIRKLKKAKKQRIEKRKKPERGKISKAVPKDLSGSFSWFIENSEKGKDGEFTQTYAILKLRPSSTYLQRVLHIPKNSLIPLALPKATLKRNRNRTSEEIIRLANQAGIYGIKEVKAIVKKKSAKTIRKNAKNNPLFSEKQRKTLERKWREANRKKYDL